MEAAVRAPGLNNPSDEILVEQFQATEAVYFEILT